MIELLESNTLARQIHENLTGKTIKFVVAAQSPHKFAWYHGDPAEYPARLVAKSILSAEAHGMFVQVNTSGGTLLISDGVNLRWHPAAGPVPAKHQLLLEFEDGSALSASVAMYGGLECWEQGEIIENSYYLTALAKPSPLSEAFNDSYFTQLILDEKVQNQSLKAALATEQRIPGLGNGCLQDILWLAGLNPRKKVSRLSEEQIDSLFTILKQTLATMTALGGRSTEKDLFGRPGAYQVVMCAANATAPCPRCGGPIIKEAYLGGSVYYCPSCQPK
ncbi:MAG TPA: zinc finger domain-containing protein [Anaerolineaceae bacterium]|nr:zinc finger domain-containing protein [Anaerolineaceae bacterium]